MQGFAGSSKRKTVTIAGYKGFAPWKERLS